MTQSESVKSLLEGLVKAQAEFTTLPKDKSGFGYKYTDLDTVISTIRPILTKQNIGFMQSLTNVDGKAGITTRVFNSSGEWIEDSVTLPDVVMAKTNAAQNMGAAITYMKRYALCAVLGISSDEDTDAAAPQPQKPAPQKAAPKPALKGGDATPEERSRIKELLDAKYANGKPVFSKEEIVTYSGYRKEKFTAKELIEFIENALRNRRGDAGELKSQTSEEWREQKLAEAEENGADAAFNQQSEIF